jgi:hypothetical protein
MGCAIECIAIGANGSSLAAFLSLLWCQWREFHRYMAFLPNDADGIILYTLKISV